MGMVEGEWGEGKALKYQDGEGDWVKMRTNDDMVDVWNQTKMGVVSVKVFSTQNQVNILKYFALFCSLFLYLFLFLFLSFGTIGRRKEREGEMQIWR